MTSAHLRFALVEGERHRAAERAYWDHVGATPTERWVDLPTSGCRVRVQELGQGPAVLFVHGVSNSGTSWGAFAARLAERYRCLLLDRPGCGLSEPFPRPVADLAAFQANAGSLLVEVLDGLQLERAHLVGTSLGGYHVLRTAALHPDRVDRVVELGFTIGAPNGPLPLVMRMSGFTRLGKLLAGMPKPERAVRSMLRQIGLREALASGRFLDPGVAWYTSLLNHTDTMRNDIDASPAVVRPLTGVNPEVLLHDDVLGAIRAPVLLRWGADDPFGGGDVARAFAPRIPGAQLQVVPGGHAVWMDDPDGAAAAVEAFLSAAG